MNVIHLEPAMVPAAMRGNYAGKKFKATVCETVTIPADAGLWSGGSRDTWHAIELETGRDAAAADHNAAPWDARANRVVTLKPGFAVVRHSMARGQDMGLTFYVHPDNAAKLLPAPIELTAFETIVLQATASLKSSYGGKDRYSMAAENSRYSHCCREVAEGALLNHEFPTRAQWEETKQVLIARGLLNKAGAITPAGRNAAK